MNRLISVLGSLEVLPRRVPCGPCLYRDGWDCRRFPSGPLPLREARGRCRGRYGRRR